MLHRCNSCLYWDTKDIRERNGQPVGKCLKMQNCFCCNYGSQIAGAIGGGHFESFGTFGCSMWRIDSRNKRCDDVVPNPPSKFPPNREIREGDIPKRKT